ADTVAEQTRQVLRNIQAVLAEHGATMDHVLKTTGHLADLPDFEEFNAAYQEFFSAPFPVRTTVGSQLANILAEIDVIARVAARHARPARARRDDGARGPRPARAARGGGGLPRRDRRRRIERRLTSRGGRAPRRLGERARGRRTRQARAA